MIMRRNNMTIFVFLAAYDDRRLGWRVRYCVTGGQSHGERGEIGLGDTQSERFNRVLRWTTIGNEFDVDKIHHFSPLESRA
jgi:hypothetical protein